MSTDGSIRRTALPPALAPFLVAAGWVAMWVATQLAVLFVGAYGIRSMLLTSEIFLVAPAITVCLLAGVSARDGLGYRTTPARLLGLSLLCGMAFWVWSLGLLEAQYAVWKPPPGYLEAFEQLHEALRPANPLDFLLSVGAIALTPAFFEELLFRGVVLPSLMRGMGVAGALILSAALFGAIHLDPNLVMAGLARHDASITLGSLYRVPFAFAVGLGLGALRVRSRSLWPPTLAHALLNTITFVAEPFVEDPTANAQANPWLGAALLAVGLTASLFLLKRVDSPPPSS
jgi:membrane protease YdiL (CAAX protease family)